MIDWQKILPNATIEYSNNGFGTDDAHYYESFLLAKLLSAMHLEISWDDDKEMYCVHLTENSFEKTLFREYFTDVDQVIDNVKTLGLKYDITKTD